MRVLLLACAVGLVFAQQPADVLARAQAQLADAASATVKYTCTQTVDRSYFREARQAARNCDGIVANQRNGRSRLVLEATDRLRFDVEVADRGYEIYAWPGESRIANEKVENMAGGGVLGTGPLGPFLIDVFANPLVEFQYLGTKIGLLEYRYRVPLNASHYRVQAGVKWRITEYDGTFLLEPVSAVLKQLTVRTGELPEDTGSCEATTSMDFGLLKIGGDEYLIPRRTRLRVIGRDASTIENATAYEECHEFRGESVVRFGERTPEAVVRPELRSGVPMPNLPAGLPISLALETEIDTDRAAAGDPIAAQVAKAVVDPVTRRVLLPAGIPVHGRITHLEHHIEGDNYFLVGLSFDSLHIILDSAHQTQDSRPPCGKRVVWSDVDGCVITTESRSGFRGGGTLVFEGRQSRYVVPRGYVSNWITLGE